jgi:hypothetical protein
VNLQKLKDLLKRRLPKTAAADIAAVEKVVEGGEAERRESTRQIRERRAATDTVLGEIASATRVPGPAPEKNGHVKR